MSDLISREAAIAACLEPHRHPGERDHAIYNAALRDAQDALRALPPAQEAAPAGEQVADLVRGVWACCEAAEDEAHSKLAADLSDHERGYFTGQRVTAKRIRRATDMPPDQSGDGNKMVPPSDMGNPISGEPVTLTYRNWRGEVSARTIIPLRLWFGSTDWHPEPQWLLTAWDAEKQADRDFALKDFGQPTAPAVKVKPLKWEYADTSYTADRETGRQELAGLFWHSICTVSSRCYTIMKLVDPRAKGDKESYRIEVGGKEQRLPTIEEAQAVAQVHCAARILAALEWGEA